MNSDVSAIKEVLNQYASSCSNGDFDLWMSLWADDGIQMPPGAPTRKGKAQIRESMSPPFEAMDLKLVLHEIEEATIHGDIGLTRCRYSLRGTPKEGGDSVDITPHERPDTSLTR